MSALVLTRASLAVVAVAALVGCAILLGITFGWMRE